MRNRAGKILLSLLFAAIIIFAVYEIFSVNRSARFALADERARQKTKNSIPFEKKILTPYPSQKIKILQNADAVRDFVKFRESYFAATSGGLVEYSADGKIIKRYSVLDGLPESDLTALRVYENKLYIGTRTKNLVAFDGDRFENYVWTNLKAQAVTALLEADGKLLVGTQNGGLLEFGGNDFAEVKAQGKTLKNITCLFKAGAQLLVGTFDDGAWIYKNDTWSHVTSAADNLPSNRVVGFAGRGEQIYLATDTGVAVSEGDTFRKVAELPALSSLISFKDRLYSAKDDGEIYLFAGKGDSPQKIISAPGAAQNSRLVPADENSTAPLLLISDQGIAEIGDAKLKTFAATSPPGNDSLPTDNFISALALDGDENLWVGTFRRGVDVFDRNGAKIRHLETENLREINSLIVTTDNGNETISAATSSGLFAFKGNGTDPIQMLGKKDGLPSDSVAYFADDYVATAKGLAYRDAAETNEGGGGKWHLISAVQGLPSNSVYTLLAADKKLYAGTLGGLTEIENGRVVRTFKDSNSNLSTNWVTALCKTRDRIFVGTYGGGIFELLPSGEIRSFAADAGKFTVNPTAFYADGERLYAGTLEGVKILDLASGEWTTFKDALPAEGVFSIAGDERKIYFGTTSGIARIDKSFFAENEAQPGR